jgi:hypothetical protein
MDHIGITREQRARNAVLEFYYANKLRRQLQRDLGMQDPYKHNYYERDSILRREMEGWLRRLSTAEERDKEALNLKPHRNLPHHSVITYIRMAFNSNVHSVSERMMSIDDSISHYKEMQFGAETLYVPRYYKELVVDKGILRSHGSCMIQKNGEETRFYGNLSTINAREIRADWIREQDIRAFKVAAVPEAPYEIKEAVKGYVIRSTLTQDVDVSFSTDIHKAISLHNRRVKKAVLEQMGV